MIPIKRSEDKEAALIPASPPPAIQKLDSKKTRNSEKSSLQYGSRQQTPTNLRKKKHWRSPSNPIELAYINRTIYSSQTHQDMLKQGVKIDRKDSCDLNMHLDSPCPVPKLGSNQLDFNSGVNINRHSSIHLSRSQFALQSSLENLIIEGKRRAFEFDEMTTKKGSQSLKPVQYKSMLQSYETMLLKGPRSDTPKFKMMAELSISPIVATGSSDYTTTKRHFFPFESAYCRVDGAGVSGSFDSTSLAHGHISITDDPVNETGNRVKRVSFSRCSLLQLILRNPEDNVVAGIFVVKLDLADMPAESRTIIRQKAYKSKCLHDEGRGEGKFDTAPDYLSKFIEIPLKRSYDSESNRQRIHLAGPIRVAFTFNRSNLRYTSPRRSDASAVEPVQKTRTVLQFPSVHQKYFPLGASVSHDRGRSSSLTTENSTRSFQHGSLCL